MKLKQGKVGFVCGLCVGFVGLWLAQIAQGLPYYDINVQITGFTVNTNINFFFTPPGGALTYHHDGVGKPITGNGLYSFRHTNGYNFTYYGAFNVKVVRFNKTGAQTAPQPLYAATSNSYCGTAFKPTQGKTYFDNLK